MGPVAPIWVFLARGRFAAKAPGHEGWILLDFGGERGAYGTENRLTDRGRPSGDRSPRPATGETPLDSMAAP